MHAHRTGGTPWTIIIDKKGVVRFNGFHISREKATALVEQLLEEGIQDQAWSLFFLQSGDLVGTY